MARIMCCDCGVDFGETLDVRDYLGLCGRCFDIREHKAEYDKRKADVMANPIKSEKVISCIEDWWRAYKKEEYDEPEDEILHEKIMKVLNGLLKKV